MREVSPTPRLDLALAVLAATFAALWWATRLLLRIGLTLIGAIIGFVFASRATHRKHEWS